MNGLFHSKIMKSVEKNRGSDKKGKTVKAKRADLRGGTVKHTQCASIINYYQRFVYFLPRADVGTYNGAQALKALSGLACST